ncbi:aspartate carbamoyltransferase regulatory subunit [Sulfuracidifex metallicus]|jgi:aspartate carbamoyltransferase regulatory subunit|uniref:Aspartate carbamoyltransferase regulatory chain n=1 Tax=Sulfuracidifex metallicus DSM 6482 = JCM 9184 TaxID=523847 RepID=A0A6A9QJ51_SULME|nr:aspartate carbamoyltransferase regulatory subunit [Sulfuracidifex metallicus]MUN28159.1 aspartate carbamoyltransferase regulatory subunit [Sulfuracidifex metallicus DSM 6482 = JCM 9184]WOE51306.1 aspartate carbamoyltransferase regulatory subunit [Sulfuracidifex metallicus DSM 6482 = JCM 9184]
MSDKELLVTKINYGTVIDHIPSGRALAVLRVLGINGSEGYRVALVMNVESKKMGRKDIVKISGRTVDEKESNLITLIAPNATINIIKDYEVVKKMKMKVPSVIRGILKCPNPSCITNNDPEAFTKFVSISENPLRIKCDYCETTITEAEVIKQVL